MPSRLNARCWRGATNGSIAWCLVLASRRHVVWTSSEAQSAAQTPRMASNSTLRRLARSQPSRPVCCLVAGGHSVPLAALSAPALASTIEVSGPANESGLISNITCAFAALSSSPPPAALSHALAAVCRPSAGLECNVWQRRMSSGCHGLGDNTGCSSRTAPTPVRRPRLAGGAARTRGRHAAGARAGACRETGWPAGRSAEPSAASWRA